ncbi:MAG: hypothetical protein IJ714_01695 [Bacteroidales bacterium]|nr:hypothetical protein [Bacteroidales bacterium]
MNDFDITDIETRLKEIVRDELKISSTVFNNRPKSADISGNDFCVVKVNGVVKDRGAYGECDVYLSLFAKDISNQKNGKKLSVMYKKLVAGLPFNDGRYIFDETPNVLGDTADDYGFHARVIQLNTIIKVKQS